MAHHKATPPWVKADKHFPVRIRVTQPPDGFGQTLTHMHHWLHERCGLKRFYQWGEKTGGAHDHLLFYFDDLDVAKEFADRFECKVATVGGAPP